MWVVKLVKETVHARVKGLVVLLGLVKEWGKEHELAVQLAIELVET
jgi:hypothetical protein